MATERYLSAATEERRQYLSVTAEERGWRFWGMSALGHALVAIVLLYSPAKVYLLAKPKAQERPPMRIRGDELSRFVDELRDQTMEQLRERVALLRAGQTRMAHNFDTLRRHVFADFETRQMETARARLEQYLHEMQTRLQRLTEAGERATAGDQSEPLLEAYRVEMAKILAGMEEIERGLQLIIALNPLVAEQRKSMEAQYAANQVHRQHEEICERITALQAQKAKLASDSEKAAADLKTAEDEVGKLSAEADEKERCREAASQALAAAAKDDKAKQAELTKAADAASAECKKAQDILAQAKKAADNARQQAKRCRTEITKVERDLAEAEKKRLEALTAARDAQSRAAGLQQSVISRVEDFLRCGAKPEQPATKAEDP